MNGKMGGGFPMGWVHVGRGVPHMLSLSVGGLSYALLPFQQDILCRMRDIQNGTHKWMDEVFWVSVFSCEVEGRIWPDKWADHLFKPIRLHPCSGMKIEQNWISTLVDFKDQGSLLSLLSVVQKINCSGLIFIESRHCLNETAEKLHQTANLSKVFTRSRKNTLLKQRMNQYFHLSATLNVQQQFQLKSLTYLQK